MTPKRRASFKSHSIRLPSSLPDASVCPSGEKARAVTYAAQGCKCELGQQHKQESTALYLCTGLAVLVGHRWHAAAQRVHCLAMQAESKSKQQACLQHAMQGQHQICHMVSSHTCDLCSQMYITDYMRLHRSHEITQITLQIAFVHAICVRLRAAGWLTGERWPTKTLAVEASLMSHSLMERSLEPVAT